MVERPAFFKFFLQEKSKAQLKIPTPFITFVGGSLPEKVFLRDCYNNLWTVKVEHVGENWYFQDGWTKFVEDNRVTSYDFIVFEYFLVSLFDFKILGPSGTETEGAGAFLSKEMKELEQVCEEVMEKAKEVKKEVGDDCEDDDYIFKRQKVQSEENGEDDDETLDADYLLGDQGNKSEDEVEEVNRVAANITGNSNGKQRSLVPKYYGLETFQSGLAPQPINPYFVVKIMPKRKNELFIPLNLIKDHNLQLPIPEMILVDPVGRKFRGNYKMWKDGRILYCGGWKRLCNSNFVERDDVCICEFKEGVTGLYLSVSFVRANGNGGNRNGR